VLQSHRCPAGDVKVLGLDDWNASDWDESRATADETSRVDFGYGSRVVIEGTITLDAAFDRTMQCGFSMLPPNFELLHRK
jgi:hypothetical protein